MPALPQCEQRFSAFRRLRITLLLVAMCGVGGATARGQATAAGKLLVSLDARDTSAGSEIWANAGSLGPFRRVGAPVIRSVQGVRGVFFDGRKDAYQGPLSVPEIEGRRPRTIEVWAYNPSVDADEETLVGWGKRGGPSGGNMALNWGRSGGYGAATHWAADLGWNGTPTPGQWHYLVYTYDGVTARVYDNTAEKSALPIVLDTIAGNSVNVAVQNGANGALQFFNEFNGSPMGGSLGIAELRIEAGALTPAQIRRNFLAEAARFGAKSLSSARDLILNSGRIHLQTKSLVLEVSKTTQEAFSLRPMTVAGTAFDFLPSDRLQGRAYDGFYQLGDIDFRTRVPGGGWQSFSTAAHHIAVRPIPTTVGFAADITPSLGANCPLSVERRWVNQNGDLTLEFVLHNRTAQAVELGAFGAAMVINNILTGRSLEETHERCSFADPYVGGEAGYLQVTRLNGKGPVLLVLPEKGTRFEAYRPLHNDPTARSVTFEGFYEWTVHSRAYAEQEWKGATEWNTPTARVLKAGESATYGFRFVLAPGVRQIESTLIACKRPVAIGIPGYVLPTDQQSKLFVHSATPLRDITVEPAGAMHVPVLSARPNAAPVAASENFPAKERGRGEHSPHARSGKSPNRGGNFSLPSPYQGGGQGEVPAPRGGRWQPITVTGVQPGRCRLTLHYADGTTQVVHYFVTLPAAEQIRNFGAFHARNQWYADPKDPFGRTFSFMPYDFAHKRMVLQYDPTWMVGLSDEMGAGPNLAMAIKNVGQPDATEVHMLEQYADNALWGHLQNADYGIRASLFYYQPDAFPGYYTVHGGWDKARTETTWRSFNYPHQAAVYWSLYRLARDHQGLVTAHPWEWYLRQAYHTAMAMGIHAGPPPEGLQQFGQMVGDVYLQILDDCKREGWNTEAADLEAYERIRADHFRSLKYPYGSEMPWDSTGQEEVYLLCRYFGYDDKADQTVEAVLAYDPTVPNWGYNGSARRYFDEAVNGTRWPDIMRLLHHYGGAMNAVPVLTAYRDHPDDFHLLRVGYGGTMGALSDIHPTGFGAQCFDADPAIMDFDPYVGDYGIEFYGFAVNTGAYLAHHPEFGWLGFGCNVSPHGAIIDVTPCDAFRNRLYIAPFGLYLTLDAGTFARARVDTAHHTVTVTLSPATSATQTALLRVETAKARGGTFAPVPAPPMVRGAYAIPLAAAPVTIRLNAANR